MAARGVLPTSNAPTPVSGGLTGPGELDEFGWRLIDDRSPTCPTAVVSQLAADPSTSVFLDCRVLSRAHGAGRTSIGQGSVLH